MRATNCATRRDFRTATSFLHFFLFQEKKKSFPTHTHDHVSRWSVKECSKWIWARKLNNSRCFTSPSFLHHSCYIVSLLFARVRLTFFGTTNAWNFSSIPMWQHFSEGQHRAFHCSPFATAKYWGTQEFGFYTPWSYKGNSDITQVILNLGAGRRYMVSSSPHLFSSPGRSLRCSLNRKLVDIHTRSGWFGEEKNHLLQPGIEYL